MMYGSSPEAENIRRRCFVLEGSQKLQTWPAGRPVSVSREDGLSLGFNSRYNFTARADDENVNMVETMLQEKELIRSVYTEKGLYSRQGRPLCITLDVALAKGGPETIVESLYSVMSSQRMDGASQMTCWCTSL